MTRHSSFNADEPLAYMLTWTTYGTWLPGDERGWNRRGKPEIQPPSALFVEMARSRMKEPAFHLLPAHRRIVEETIRNHCEIRGWRLHAINVRTNHVHAVLTAPGYHPATAREQLKSWCTRKLKHAGVRRNRCWTEGGSCRWINQEDDLETAITYVVEAQDRKGAEEGRC